jgi:hypothetical protein
MIYWIEIRTLPNFVTAEQQALSDFGWSRGSVVRARITEYPWQSLSGRRHSVKESFSNRLKEKSAKAQ